MNPNKKLYEMLKSTKARAVETLLDWKSPAKLADLLGVTVASVCHWRMRGQIPKTAVEKLMKIKNCPLSASDMRPDLYN